MTLSIYQNSLKGFSGGFVQYSTLESQQAYLASAISGQGKDSWATIVSGAQSALSAQDNLNSQESLGQSLEIWRQTLALLEDGAEMDSMDPYSFDVLVQSLVSFIV